MIAHEQPKVVHLDDLESIPGPGSLTWHPVRVTLGIRAFGCNAYTAADAGQDVVEPHAEDPKLAHLQPGLPEAGQGNREGALAALRGALELRPEVAEWARDDEDFESLRDDPEFRSLAALP